MVGDARWAYGEGYEEYRRKEIGDIIPPTRWDHTQHAWPLPRRQVIGIVTPFEDLQFGVAGPWPEGQSPFFSLEEGFSDDERAITGYLGGKDALMPSDGGWPKVEQVPRNYANKRK